MARWIYERAGFDQAEPPGPSRIAAALGIQIATAPKRGAWGHGCLVRLSGQWQVWLAPGLPAQHKAFAIAHELAEWAFRDSGIDELEPLCDATAGAILAPRKAFASVTGHAPDFAALAKMFRTTESCVALRFGEVVGHPLALVSPRLVRVRGEDWCWPDEQGIRRLVSRPNKNVRVVSLSDDRERRVILAA